MSRAALGIFCFVCQRHGLGEHRPLAVLPLRLGQPPLRLRGHKTLQLIDHAQFNALLCRSDAFVGEVLDWERNQFATRAAMSSFLLFCSIRQQSNSCKSPNKCTTTMDVLLSSSRSLTSYCCHVNRGPIQFSLLMVPRHCYQVHVV